jgi:glycosyltransferase involved in cell wall biosynthesis
VVGVNEGGVRETIVDGVTGVLAPRNAAEFGQRIMELMRDPRRAERMAVAARKHVISRFNWEGHMEQLETLLQDVAKSRKPVPALSVP